MVKLYYFDLEARGEIPRLAYALTGQKYDDVRFGFPDWPKYKPNSPSGQAPYLELDDGKMLTESVALSVYAGKKGGIVPDDPFELGKMMEIIMVTQNRFTHLHKLFKTPEAERPAAVKAINEKELKELVKVVDKLVATSQCEKSGFIVNGKFSVADIAVYDFVRGLTITKLAGMQADPSDMPHLMKTFNVVLAKVKAANYPN